VGVKALLFAWMSVEVNRSKQENNQKTQNR
ncbi:uncharacterized protein METZ01_LOCUS273042, partial [marine metagenome]